jgi:hypothetical protein
VPRPIVHGPMIRVDMVRNGPYLRIWPRAEVVASPHAPTEDPLQHLAPAGWGSHEGVRINALTPSERMANGCGRRLLQMNFIARFYATGKCDARKSKSRRLN